MTGTEPATTLHCNVCELDCEPAAATAEAAGAVERAEVTCNVRTFQSERFPVWRCPRCLSIHGEAQVDLAHYYAKYPFHLATLDLFAMAYYDNLMRRLRRAGLRKPHRVLDYGCGSGHLVQFLKSKGYAGVVGYDAYSAEFRDEGVLAERYDCVVAQDVIEHVDDPRALLRQLGALCRPGGLLAIGTPNAEAVDLQRADLFRHTLHQPYHLHILSRRSLLDAGQQLGWQLVRYYKRQYSNTLWPFLNQAYALYYARCFDDTLDLAFDGPRFSPRLLLPQALFLALFGYFFSVETDIMAIFRVGDVEA